MADRLEGPRVAAARRAAASRRDRRAADDRARRPGRDPDPAKRSRRTSGDSTSQPGGDPDATRRSRTEGSETRADPAPETAERRPAPWRRPPAGRRPRRWIRVTKVIVVLVAVVLVATQLVSGLDDEDPSPGVAGVPMVVADGAPDAERDVEVHAGYGTWVDVYDYMPGGSGPTPVTPDTLADMADQGVHTLYLQAAQFDEARTSLLTDPRLLGEFLVQAHLAGMRVVGWYLPRFVDVDRDLAHLVAISDFEALGHRFDGVAVDIEWTNGVPDHVRRSDLLVDLSERLRESVGDDDALGAVVLPPVQIEVVNPNKWPDFPWRELADLYDVWLPMGYWTERRPDSGYQDGWTYTDENIRRVRENLDDPDAVVHAIGGIGDGITSEQAQRFVRALDSNDAIGGSIYDWSTLDPAVGAEIADDLPAPDD